MQRPPHRVQSLEHAVGGAPLSHQPGVFLIPHRVEPDFFQHAQEIPRDDDVRRHKHPLPAAAGKAPFRRFHFLQPVARRDTNPSLQCGDEELSPALRVAPAVEIPISMIMSVVPTHSPPPQLGQLGAPTEQDARAPAPSESPARVLKQARKTRRSVATSGESVPHSSNESPPRQRKIVMDKSPSAESLEAAQRLRQIAAECRQVEQDHMAMRRKRRYDRRSHEHHELMYEKQAAAWKDVCDSTVVLAVDRMSIEKLYKTPLLTAAKRLLPPIDYSRQTNHNSGFVCTDEKEDDADDEHSANNSRERLNEFVTESSVLLGNVSADRIESFAVNDPRRFKGNASPSKLPHITGPSPVVAQRTTQDIIAAMERRYQLEAAYEERRAEQQRQREVQCQRLDEAKMLAARHAVHQQLSAERRREDAKKRAEEQESARIEEIKSKLLERESRKQYRKRREVQHVARGALDNMSAIARRNDIAKFW